MRSGVAPYCIRWSKEECLTNEDFTVSKHTRAEYSCAVHIRALREEYDTNAIYFVTVDWNLEHLLHVFLGGNGKRYPAKEYYRNVDISFLVQSMKSWVSSIFYGANASFCFTYSICSVFLGENSELNESWTKKKSVKTSALVQPHRDILVHELHISR